MVPALPPKPSRILSRKTNARIWSVMTDIRQRNISCPNAFSASSFFCWPRKIDMTAPVPTPPIMPNAAMMIMIGIVNASPANASLPTPLPCHGCRFYDLDFCQFLHLLT